MAKKEHKGVIYILTNPSFPDYVKIGYATDIEQRLKQLNRSETIPYAFRVYAIYEVESDLTDKELHKLIDSLNPDLRTIETYSLLDCIAKISGTTDRLKKMKPEGHEVKDEKIAEDVRAESKRGPFRFSDCNIPFGSEVAFVEDESVVATVIDDRHILYNGQTTSLSALARELKHFDHHVQGTVWFKYKGEVLNDLRLRLEKR